MKSTRLVVTMLAFLSLAVMPASARRNDGRTLGERIPTNVPSAHSLLNGDRFDPMVSATAAQGTTVLYVTTFNNGGSCTDAGWTNVDITAQVGDYFHIDDYSGLNPADFTPLSGAQSLWCGARPSAANPLCGYSALPGYGNGWNQAFCTKGCIAVSGDGLLDMSFLMKIDSEPGYDATTLEYTTDCSGASGWTPIAGGLGVWDDVLSTTINQAYNIGTAGPVKVRFHFASDGAWSDEDGLWATDGAVHIDNLQAEGLPLEDFEGEIVGATDASDWQSCTPDGYGTYFGLFPGWAMVQGDPCRVDVSCLWAALVGSTANYACGGYPAQTAVPYGNANGQYLNNEIWSPDIPLTGSGSVINYQFSVYRDLNLDALIFYVWHVRTILTGGCAGAWQDRDFVSFGGQRDWLVQTETVGDLLDLVNGTAMNAALGVADLCGVWCGQTGSGACHSHAPLFDNVKVYRVDAQGPQWSIRDIDQFQDNFAEDGTITGTARADMANDITPGSHYGSIIPGDSAVVQVSDPEAGMGVDPGNSRAAVYCYVAVWPQGQPGKSGAGLVDDAVRWPVVGTWVDASGVTWTCVQLDSTVVNGNVQPDRYCVDLNDNLFTPCDTVCFFYCAKNANGLETYAFGSNLGAHSSDREEAAANPSEFTILPAGGWKRGGDILYVDGMDGRGSQPYWDSAFQSLGILEKVDRYDVRGPSSSVSNRPAGRVKNVTTQLLDCYRKILWDCGDLTLGLGNGTGSPEKTDDYQLVNAFLGGLANPGGVYIAGDDTPTELNTYQSASIGPNGEGTEAITFRSTWMTHTLTSSNAKLTYGISPTGTAVAGGCFVSDPTFVIYGGCPLINDFDVMTPTGTAVNDITYGAGTAASTNGAVLSQATNNGSANVGVLFGGFSFAYIRDDDNNGVMDRADFLYDAISWLGNVVAAPTPVPSTAVNRLDQNYPNPFNPQTSIAFSLKERGLVSLNIYNVAGERVRTLADTEFGTGPHTKVWDGRNDAGQPVSSGVYFYQLVTSRFTQTRKMVLLK
ncbi:MAG TPA: FlgD immunoglobulin-like domain containing protein [Candidatus Krumholzibacteria bacterium]|nr:FlgD immunoglobulin-like domain containing protein [Candidatus Krumholzibacteria bacterium]